MLQHVEDNKVFELGSKIETLWVPFFQHILSY
jgi:hypothetical protein